MEQHAGQFKRSSGKERVLLIAVFFLSLFPMLLMEPGWLGFLLTGVYLCIYFAGLSYWMRFFPSQPQGQIRQPPSFSVVLFHIITGKRTVASIREGQFDRDYFALRKKPALRSIIIDSHSAAVFKANDGGLSVLRAGHWQLKRGETVAHIFDLRPGFFTYGPHSAENPFHLLQGSHRDPVSQHAAAIEIEETQCTTANGATIAPLFSIVYSWNDHAALQTFDQQMAAVSAYLMQNNIFGNANQQVERMLGSIVAQIFRSYACDSPLNVQTDFGNGNDGLLSAFQQLTISQEFGALAGELVGGKHAHSLLGLLSLKVELVRIWTA